MNGDDGEEFYLHKQWRQKRGRRFAINDSSGSVGTNGPSCWVTLGKVLVILAAIAAIAGAAYGLKVR